MTSVLGAPATMQSEATGRSGAMSLTESELADARLTIRRGLDEDLRYGPDVTTEATVPSPPGLVSVMFVPRKSSAVSLFSRVFLISSS